MRHTFCGTLDYISPEMAQGADYDQKLDNWAIGVLAFEFLTGKPPFEGNTQAPSKLASIKKGEIRFPNFMSWEAKHFVSGLLDIDPAKRMGLKAALNHPFIQRSSRKNSN